MTNRIRALWGGLILFFVLFSFVPTFYELSQRKNIPDYRGFELVHNYYTDYNFYLSRIREGYEGRFSVIERYTTEPHDPSFIQVFYLFLGTAARFISNPDFAVPAAYHMARAVCAIAFLAVVAEYCRKMFAQTVWQVLAFLLAVTAVSYPVIVPMATGGFRFGNYMSWWTVMDSLQRITFIPHLVAGQAMVAFMIMAGSDITVLKRSANWLFLGVMAFVLGMIFPPGMVFIAFAYGFMVVFEAIADRAELADPKKRKAWIVTHIVSRFLIGIMYLPSAAYFQLMFQVYPWKRLVEFDQLNPTVFSYVEYIKSLGFTLPLGILGILVAFTRKERKAIGLISWVFAWAFCLWLFQFIPQQSPLRFSEMAPHVALGIMSAYLFFQLILFAAKKLSPAKKHPQAPFVFTGLYLLAVIPIVLGLGWMGSSVLWQEDFVNQKVRAGWPFISMNNYIVYPVKGVKEALNYFMYQTPADAVILTDLSMGNYIPAYAGRTVYVGHDNTVHKEYKLGRARKFYAGEMTVDEALTFIREEKITHVFFGPQERENGKLADLAAKYPFLREAYRNDSVVVFTP